MLANDAPRPRLQQKPAHDICNLTGSSASQLTFGMGFSKQAPGVTGGLAPSKCPHALLIAWLGGGGEGGGRGVHQNGKKGQTKGNARPFMA